MENSIKAKFYMPLLTLLLNNVIYTICIIYIHTHTFNGPFSGTTQVSRYQKGKTNLDFTEARDSEWQWHQLGHMQVCNSLQTTTPATHHSCFLQAGCPSCHPTNSVKALKGFYTHCLYTNNCIIYAVRETESMWLIKYAYTTFCACIT